MPAIKAASSAAANGSISAWGPALRNDCAACPSLPRPRGLATSRRPASGIRPAIASPNPAQDLATRMKRPSRQNGSGTPGASEPYNYDDLDAVTDEFGNKLMQVNLVGRFRVTRAAKPQLVAAKGAVVNIASIAGLHMRGSSIVYSATKAGVISLT